MSPASRDTQLVGRDTVLTRLDEVIETLTAGESGVLGLTGPLGAGRSALITRAVARARAAGSAVGHVRCSPVESQLPYAAMSHLFIALRPPPRVVELAAICLRGGSTEALIALLCDEFLALAADRPLTLAVDDVQWADVWSLHWFAAMTRRVQDAPVLLIGASHGPLSGHLGEDCIVNTGCAAVHELPLPPLTPQDSQRLLTAVVGREVDASVAATATDLTMGRPAVLHAVAEHFAARDLPLTPERVGELTLAARSAWSERNARAVRGLPADALALLRVLCLGGGATFEYEIVGSLTGLGTTSLERALDILLAAGLVTGPDAPRPACSSLPEDVLAGMDAVERNTLCLRAAELGWKVGADADTVAGLLGAAPATGLPWAPEVLAEASMYRLRQGRPDSAVAALRRALREPMPDADRARLLNRLASVEVATAPQASDGRLCQVLVRYPHREVLPSVVEAADLLLSRGDAATAHRTIADAYRAWNGSMAEETRSPLLALGRLAQEESGPEPRGPVAPLPPPIERPADPAQAAVLAWQLATRAVEPDRARKLARAALTAYTDLPLMCRIAASSALRCTDDQEAALAGLDAVVVEARRRNARASAAQALLHRARVALGVHGAEVARQDLAAAARELPLSSWHPMLLARFVAGEIVTELRCGRLDDAQRAAARPLAAGADQGIGWGLLCYAKGELCLVTGDPERALVYLDECGRLLRARRWRNPMLVHWRSTAALAHRMLGAPESAARLLAEERALLHGWGTGGALERAHARLTDMLSAFGVELPAAPETMEEPEPLPLAELAPPEWDVLQLALSGLANREIADELGVATRTVELRLTKVYRKLGVRGRTELAARFAPAVRKV
ncbi:AAA family ATPase [Streptomyces coffeae]|uniref:AAA family ATPase n=1 Tax=Streptomyces coffeae TaxID=621382 RepID=A0ABS1NJL8_9ACTN|nr:LuxR family transcriptional regulator [Streptomyces coffeae]MBL1100231.1 AAA family ATPase [Streptomyces coffeae]